MTPEVSQAELASMGLAGLQPISDAAGRQVRGSRAIFGGFDAVGIPLDSVGRARLVALINWSYHEGLPDLGAVIRRRLIGPGEYAEPIPPGLREF